MSTSTYSPRPRAHCRNGYHWPLSIGGMFEGRGNSPSNRGRCERSGVRKPAKSVMSRSRFVFRWRERSRLSGRVSGQGRRNELWPDELTFLVSPGERGGSFVFFYFYRTHRKAYIGPIRHVPRFPANGICRSDASVLRARTRNVNRAKRFARTRGGCAWTLWTVRHRFWKGLARGWPREGNATRIRFCRTRILKLRWFYVFFFFFNFERLPKRLLLSFQCDRCSEVDESKDGERSNVHRRCNYCENVFVTSAMVWSARNWGQADDGHRITTFVSSPKTCDPRSAKRATFTKYYSKWKTVAQMYK
jgi:hypothetical protein